MFFIQQLYNYDFEYLGLVEEKPRNISLSKYNNKNVNFEALSLFSILHCDEFYLDTALFLWLVWMIFLSFKLIRNVLSEDLLLNFAEFQTWKRRRKISARTNPWN